MNFLQTIQEYSADLVRRGRSFVFQVNGQLYGCTAMSEGVKFHTLVRGDTGWHKMGSPISAFYDEDSGLKNYHIISVEVIRFRYENTPAIPTLKLTLTFYHDHKGG